MTKTGKIGLLFEIEDLIQAVHDESQNRICSVNLARLSKANRLAAKLRNAINTEDE